jgi:hypothetical protein
VTVRLALPLFWTPRGDRGSQNAPTETTDELHALKHSMKLARQIEPGMRERLGLKLGEKGLSLTSIKRVLCILCNILKNRSSLTE